MRAVLVTFGCLALTVTGACSDHAPGNHANEFADHSRAVQSGQFQFYPATGNMPAVLLDTSTGCLEELVKLTAIDNPKQVSWARKYMDATIPDVADGKAVPQSGPPTRCADQKPSRVIKYDANGKRISNDASVEATSEAESNK